MIDFIKYAVIRVFGPDRLGLDKALWKSDIGPRLGFPEVSGLPGQRGRPSWENPRTGPVESRGGVSGREWGGSRSLDKILFPFLNQNH